MRYVSCPQLLYILLINTLIVAGYIGSIQKDKKDNIEAAYQDSVTVPIGCEHDDDAVSQEDGDDNDPDPPEEQEVILWVVSSAVEKVHNHYSYVELWLILACIAMKNCLSCISKSPMVAGLALRSLKLTPCCSDSNCTHAHFQCQNSLVIHSPDAS